MSVPSKPDASALERLEALIASWTPEERAAQNERFRNMCKVYANHLRFKRNAELTWQRWLETTRSVPHKDDDST